MFEALKKKVVGMIPGTALNGALEKRQMERDLRRQGYSRSHAQALASQHFATKGNNHLENHS